MRWRNRCIFHLAAGRIAHARNLPGQGALSHCATGYIQGYLVAGARPGWLATKEGKEIATRWLRATMKGRDVAAKDFKAVAEYAAKNLNLREKATKDQWDTNIRPIALDKIYYDDFCSLSRWAQNEKATDGKIDYNTLTSGEALKSIDPKLVTAPPAALLIVAVRKVCGTSGAGLACRFL
jgi:hypothetical protein